MVFRFVKGDFLFTTGAILFPGGSLMPGMHLVPTAEQLLLRQVLRLCAKMILGAHAIVRNGYTVPGKTRTGMGVLYRVALAMALAPDAKRFTVSQLAANVGYDRKVVRSALKQLEADYIVTSNHDAGEFEVGYYWRFDVLGKSPDQTQCRIDWLRVARLIISIADDLKKIIPP